NFFDLLNSTPSSAVSETVGIYLEEALTLGKRTAELHLALATPTDNLAFTLENFTEQHFQQLSDSFCQHAEMTRQVIEQSRETLSDQTNKRLQKILDRFQKVLNQLQQIAACTPNISKIRIHGDYHLGQLLWVENDFFIIDFEGEPARSIEERRMKQSPLKDVAGMIRSFSYAAHAALDSFVKNRPEDSDSFAPWASLWEKWVSATFLKGYLDLVRTAGFIPTDPNEFKTLLSAFILDKAFYELNYELNHRPDWVRIPISGIEMLLESQDSITTS
ncbi:MAG TPA: phosphotransferase, partial [Acidobacteriota bacterium]